MTKEELINAIIYFASDTTRDKEETLDGLKEMKEEIEDRISGIEGW